MINASDNYARILHEYFITVSQADDDYKDKMGEN